LAVQQTLLREAWGFTESDELLHVLPLHHMHGLCIALLTALGALSRVRMLAAFDGPNVWESLAHCTSFMAVPTIYAKLFTSYDAAPPETRERWRRHAKGLRLATSGSAALPVSLARRWHDLTGTIPLERFGMTELGVALSNPLNGPRREGSIGKPLPTVDIRIVNDQGEDASQGELWVAGPSVFQGYFEKPEANASAFVDQEGKRYFRTGDTVERSPDGYVRVLGRTSVDILKSGGYKLSALEIEEVLREADAVAEVAVVGLPDETWGERVVACVVAKPGRETECDEVTLRAFAKTRLASYKVPKNVLPMTELPRNAMGKVIKPELVRLISKGNEHRSTAETKSASTVNDSSAKTR
jgi:malonyl-CoA/methylmalonyl-CoA synthetase